MPFACVLGGTDVNDPPEEWKPVMLKSLEKAICIVGFSEYMVEKALLLSPSAKQTK